MADRGPWYTIKECDTHQGLDVHRHDGILVAYSVKANAAGHWAVYERPPETGVWSFIVFRETDKMIEYMNDPKKFPQKAS